MNTILLKNFSVPKITCLLFLICIINPTIYAQFTDVAATTGVDQGGNKDGGIAWVDLNNDGCLDLIVNTNTNNSSNRTRMFLSDCTLPNPTFTDITATHANGLRLNLCERSISVGDYNNDGYLDFCRNTHNRIEVYLNKGPGATPAYSFGDASQNPNLVITSISGGMNAEGFGWMDYNNDGWLDLIIENHNFGIDIYQNPADGSALFTHVTPNATPLGLPTGGTTGDYMALCDYDDDGDVDIFARKQGERDIWTNTGAGTFTANLTFNEDANNSNKGGVLFCDFDNDGDFDLFWSSQGTNQIFEQTGLNSGTFTATAEPETSSGISISSTVDGCSCGDVDNDGDMDLFLGGSSGANSYLFLNDGGGAFNFTQNNMGITPGGNTEGTSFGDYDNDGDLDLYVQRNGGSNELWRNPLNDNNFLKVSVKRDVGGGILRDDLGATIVLKDCDGNVISGIRQVSSVKGHGSNDPAVVHFGLPAGNTSVYLLEVRYTTVSGTRSILDSTIIPEDYTDQTLTIVNPSGAGGFIGCVSLLPIELIEFNATTKLDWVALNWKTASEINNDFFTIERSINGIDWEQITTIRGAGNSSTTLSYQTVDKNPSNGISYYRLKQTDYDGAYEYSDIRTVRLLKQANVVVHKQPTEQSIVVMAEKAELEGFEIYTVLGQNVTAKVVEMAEGENQIELDLSALSSGLYIIKSRSARTMFYW